MKRKHVVVLIAVLVCVSFAGVAAAQSTGPSAPAAAVTTKFTHQGQLKRNGVLYTGTCDMRFTLWDDATAGTQQASYTAPAPVTVSDGVFAVEVDFGAQFTGNERWIQTETQCADDVSYQNLPRVAINPTPYAIGLMPGAQTIGSLNGTGGIIGATNNGEGAALVGLANSPTGVTYGVLGTAYSPNGYALWGFGGSGATAVRGVSVGVGPGVWGTSTDSSGVLGESTNFNGVRGIAHNPNSGAVVGIHDGGGIAVYGESASQIAVYGRSTSATGVYGTSTSFIGVYGESTSFEGVRGTSHNANHGGVVGINDAAGGIAIYGNAPNGGYAGYFQGKVGIAGGADLAERFATADNAKVEPGTVMVIDEDHSGKLKVSDGAYDGKVIGIISGAGGINTGLTLHQDGALEGDLIVAIAGRVYCKAEANSSPIKPGDLLTTSSVKGHCMKATDRELAYGAVIGKALTSLDHGEGLVLVIVNLQ